MQMKAIGKRSISSFLTVLVSGGFYAVAVMVVVMLFLASMPLFTDLSNTELGIPVSFSINTGVLRVADSARAAPDAEIRNAYGTLRFPPASGTVVTATALLAALALAIGLWVLAQLRAVLRTLRDGRPFIAANASRIRWIGLAVIAWELMQSLVLFSANSYARMHFAAGPLRFDAWPTIDLSSVVYGLIILVIAEVFKAGARLEEEQSLTI